MQKKVMLILLAMSLVFTMAACSKEAKPDPNAALVTVNDTPITQAEFDVEYNKTIEYYESVGTTLTDAQIVQVKNSILDSMIRDLLLKQYSAKDEYEPTEEDVEAKYQELVVEYETEENLKNALTENDLTVEDLRDDLKIQLDIDKFLNDYVKDNNLYAQIVVTDKEVEDEFLRYVMQTGNQDMKLSDYADIIKEQLRSNKMSKLVTSITDTLMAESKIENKTVFE